MCYTGPQSHDIDSDWGLGGGSARCRGGGARQGEVAGGGGGGREASSCLQPYLTLGLTLRMDMRRE